MLKTEFKGLKRTEFLAQRLQLINIRLVLRLVFHLLLDSLKHADSSSVVIDTSGSTNGGLYNGSRRYEIVGEAVVKPPLDLEQILRVLEKGDISLRERLEGLLGMTRGGAGENGGGTCAPGDERGPGSSAEDGGEQGGTHYGEGVGRNENVKESLGWPETPDNQTTTKSTRSPTFIHPSPLHLELFIPQVCGIVRFPCIVQVLWYRPRFRRNV